MQVTVSRVSPVEVELKVELPKEKISTALAQAYGALGRTAQIRGFRRGKVPLPILKQYFSGRVSTEVVGKLIDETLPQALAQEKLDPVVRPSLKDTEPPDENKPWSYTATLEVRPAIDKLVIDGIEVSRKVYTVADVDVDHQIEHLRDEHGTLRLPDPPRAVRAGDVVTFDYTVSIDGNPKPDMSVQGRRSEIGKGKLLPAIDAGVIGMNVGESRAITTEFAADHAREDLRGKTAIFEFALQEVQEKVLPDVDDEFAKDVGSESLDALKAKLRADMERQGREATDQQVREDAILALAEKNPIVVPPSLVNNAVSMISRELAQMMRIRGDSMDVKKVIEEAQQTAEQRVRAGILLGELARVNDLTVTEEELQARIEQMAKDSGKAAAKIRAEHRDARKREGLANTLLEDKVVALLLSKVKVTDVASDKPLHDHDHDH